MMRSRIRLWLLVPAMGAAVGLMACRKETIDMGQAMEQAMGQWVKEAKLDVYETPEQLYQKALEEDTLVVYSTTTRIHQVKASFEQAYPGLTVEIYDMRAYDMVDTLVSSYESGELACDVAICSDNNGRLQQDLLDRRIVNVYAPEDIKSKLRPEAEGELLYFTGEAEQLFYNAEFYDSCPIENWWELTEPQWRGKVYMNSPLRSHPAYGLLHSVIANSEQMEKAYQLRYGEPLKIPAGSDGGKEFWKRLVDNQLQFTTSSNELIEIVGTPGQQDPPLVFMISSKMRRNTVGMCAQPAYGVIPTDGVYSQNSVSIVGGSKNVNTAKLFVRWLMGESDGTGEGLKPYLTEGTWSVRTDVKSGNETELAEGNFWFNDMEDVIRRREEITAFWMELQGSQ